MAGIGQRLLWIYVVASTSVLGVAVLHGAAASKANQFDEITGQRVNVVEPDGTLRMVISNHARLPGVIVQGRERPPVDRPQAGMIFYNDEGSENGGLIFGGRRNAKGDVVDSGGSLSFDKYGASDVVQLAGVDDSVDRFAGLSVTDSVGEGQSHQRIWVGRDKDGAATVTLMDDKGRKRISMEVAADGTPQLSFLAADGTVVKQLVPAK
jgi:hypothetical protein